ncbi:MAG: biotin--[acetyl-CoA-carboxylase] ligase [Leptospirales bacterium]
MRPPFLVLDTVDSTNDFLKRESQYREMNFFAVRAIEQTAGRGRHNRTWDSAVDNLSFSFVFKAENLNNPAIISIYTGLALHKALTRITGAQIQIKWPNDITCNSAKLAGILSELVFDQGKPVVITGIGLNVNSTPSIELIQKKSICLHQILVQEYNLDHIMLEILSDIRELFYDITTTLPDSIIREWNKAAACAGKKIVIVENNENIECTIHGLEPNGNLLVEDQSGKTHSLQHGEITFVENPN